MTVPTSADLRRARTSGRASALLIAEFDALLTALNNAIEEYESARKRGRFVRLITQRPGEGHGLSEALERSRRRMDALERIGAGARPIGYRVG